jgi:2-polyprenyl-3-methyl-5-hydroxy-6-metoxy-1,4-benzoquinol methylase
MEPPMATTVEQETSFPAPDPEALAAGQRLLGDLSAAVTCILCAVGDRLHLFEALALGPATSAELAERANVDERYAREWLRALTAASYLTYDDATGRFELPPALVPLLAVPGQPMYLGGGYQQLPGLVGPFDAVVRAFREGGGVSGEAYGEHLWEGMERTSAGWFDTLLPGPWLAALPDLRASLEEGAAVADVGCGRGRALISLARAFPRSRFVGYDAFEPALDAARRNAESAGVADRVRFEQRDVSSGLPDRYDLVTTFDVLHDVAEPVRVLEALRAALEPDGTYLLLELRAGETIEENMGPVGAMLYATSVLFCLPTSLADGAPGYGTLGLPESKVRELCLAAGFAAVRRLPIENPFNVLYEVTP